MEMEAPMANEPTLHLGMLCGCQSCPRSDEGPSRAETLDRVGGEIAEFLGDGGAWHSPITVPAGTLRAANNVVVPWRW